MNNASRIEQITLLLQQSLDPMVLEVIDDSHLHRGHVGAKSGKGHFTVKITSQLFRGIRKLQQHRLIYQALGEMMQTEIHALRIESSE